MKRIFSALLLGLMTIGMVQAASTDGLLRFVPAGSQGIIEIDDVHSLLTAVKASGQEAQACALLNQILRVGVLGEDCPEFAPSCLELLDGGSLLAAIQNLGWSGPKPTGKGLLVIQFASEANKTAFLSTYFPTLKFPPANLVYGDFSLRRASKDPLSTQICENSQTLVITRGIDMAQVMESSRTAKPALTWASLPSGPEQQTSGHPILRVLLRQALRQAILERMLDEHVRAAKEGRLSQRGALGVIGLMLPPDQAVTLLKTLVLQSLGDTTFILNQDGNRCVSSLNVNFTESRGFLADYLGGLATQNLGALDAIPQDIVSTQDYLVDLPLLVKLLVPKAGKDFHDALKSLEALCQAQLGLSLQDDLLPFAGTEMGILRMQTSEAGSPEREVFFCVPRNLRTQVTILESLQKTAKIRIETEEIGPSTIHHLLPPAGSFMNPLHLLQMRGVVFISESSAAILQIAKTNRTGRQLADQALMRPYDRLRGPGCLGIALSRTHFAEAAPGIRSLSSQDSAPLLDRGGFINRLVVGRQSISLLSSFPREGMGSLVATMNGLLGRISSKFTEIFAHSRP